MRIVAVGGKGWLLTYMPIRVRPSVASSVILEVVGKRSGAAAIQEGAKVRVTANSVGEVVAIRLAKGVNPRIAVLLARLAVVVAVPSVESRLLCHVPLHEGTSDAFRTLSPAGARRRQPGTHFVCRKN